MGAIVYKRQTISLTREVGQGSRGTASVKR